MRSTEKKTQHYLAYDMDSKYFILKAARKLREYNFLKLILLIIFQLLLKNLKKILYVMKKQLTMN